MSTDLKGKGKGKEQQPPVSVAAADEDDDFDELDDVLDQFKAAPLEGRASSSVTPGTASAYDRLGSSNAGSSDAHGANADGEGGDDDDDDDDDDFEAVFAAELAKEMEKMLGGLKPSKDSVEVAGSAGPASHHSEQETAEQRQFRETLEQIMKDSVAGGQGAAGGEGEGDIDLDALSKLMSGLGAGSIGDGKSAASPSKSKGAASSASSAAATAAASSSAPAAPPASFQDTIKATMSKLAESEVQHKNRSARKGKGGLPGVDPDDPLAALMAQMEALSGGEGGDGEDGDGDLPGLLDGLMDQLMSKELLYDPIKELKVKYPEYLSSAEGRALPQDERDRFSRQSDLIHQIAGIFESPTYSDSDKETREKIAELMQKMQDAGQPPKHLLGELGPAMGLAGGLGGIGGEGGDGDCVIC